MKPILILKFPYSSQFGGGERHTLTVFEEVQRRGGKFFFVGSCSVLRKEFAHRQWPVLRWWVGKEPVALWSLLVFPITALPAWLSLAIIFLAYRMMHGIRTLYCLSLTEKILLTPLAWLTGVRVLWIEHVSTERWLSQSPLRFLYRLWSRFATVIAVSQHLANEIQGLGVAQRAMRVIYNGVDLKAYAGFHRRFSHWTSRFVVGSISRLEPEKGIACLLQAFQQVLVIVPQARLIVVGDGSERRQLEWLAKQLAIHRSVQFVGFQKNVSGWMKSFDCFVLPSVGRESFGAVLLEALAATCPVVATNLGGIPEVIQQNYTGLLVEPRDIENLTRAILYLYRHPDEAYALAQNGRQLVVGKFRMETMLDQMLQLFT